MSIYINRKHRRRGRAGGGGAGGGMAPPYVGNRRKIGNLLCCRNLRGQACLHIQAGILLLFVVQQCETCLNKKYMYEITEIGLSLRFPNIRL